jgi:uncharacterized protein YjeT (DUF2065 family)
MDWNDLFAAVALVLIIEGIMPFASPEGVRRVCAAFSRLEDRSLRMTGLLSMAIGAVFLYFLRQ